MPLAAAGVWFDSDTGETPRRKAHVAAANESQAIFLFQDPMPIEWFTTPETRRERRKRFYSDSNADLAWPELAGITQRIDWFSPPSSLSLRERRRVGSQEFDPSPIICEALAVPAPAAWLRPQEELVRGEHFLRAEQAADFPWAIPGRYPPLDFSADSHRYQPPKRPFLEAPSFVRAPGTTDIPAYEIIVQQQPDLARLRQFRAVDSAPAYVPDADFIDQAKRAPALFSDSGAAMRPTPKARFQDEPTSAAVVWYSVIMAIDAKGHVDWMPQPDAARKMKPYRFAEPERVPQSAETLLAVPWLPTEDGARPVMSRQWRSIPDFAAPDWLTSGVVSVAGPFVVMAAQLFAPGAVDGIVEGDG